MIKIELPSERGKVISIEAAKHTTRYTRRLFDECPHNRIEIDQTLTSIHCLDCDKDINPVIWLTMLAEEWQRIERLTAQYNEAAEKLLKRSRVKCRHCGEMTPIVRI